MMTHSTSTTRTPMMIQVEEIEDMAAPLSGPERVICARDLSAGIAAAAGRPRGGRLLVAPPRLAVQNRPKSAVNAALEQCVRSLVDVGRNVTGVSMITRQFALATVVIAAIAPALAQDAVETTSSIPLRATGGAYPARQDTHQWLGSNLIGAKVVGAANATIGSAA